MFSKYNISFSYKTLQKNLPNLIKIEKILYYKTVILQQTVCYCQSRHYNSDHAH